MKDLYDTPVALIYSFAAKDVITVSGGSEDLGYNPDEDNVGDGSGLV